MVRKKKFILKAIILCLMPVLMLALFVGKTYAYYIDDNGNIQSNNLFNIDKATHFGSLTINDGIVGGSDTKPYFAFQVQLYNDDTLYRSTDVGDYYSARGVSYTFTKNPNFNYIQFGHNGSMNDVKLRYYVGDLSNGSYTLTMYLVSTGAYKEFKEIMLSKGATGMLYEPYGTWFASNSNSYIYYLVNNATVELYGTNERGGTYNYIMNESYKYVEGNLIDYSGIPDIYDYIYNHDDYYFRIKFKLQQPTNHIITFSFSDNLIAYTAVLLNSTNGQSYTFIRSDDTYNLKCDTSSYYYDTITVDGFYSSDYITFNMFISDDSYSYTKGYDTGYSEGYSDGHDVGYDESFDRGQAYGYQQGYNAGANSNLETNGMKTLFNSILSFPVNMIKSVFNFEFMGINIASVIMFVISIGIVAFVIKKFL